MSTEWTEASSDVIHTAQMLINKYHLHLKEANIAFIFRDKAQKSGNKFVLGHASKVSDREKPLFNYDFLIWLSEEDYSKGNQEFRESLIDHELCHCGGLPGEWKIRHHDFEEFTEIVERHGLWTGALLSTRRAEQIYQLSLYDKISGALQNTGKVEAVKPPQVEHLEKSEAEQTEEHEATDEAKPVDHSQAANDLLDNFLSRLDRDDGQASHDGK